MSEPQAPDSGRPTEAQIREAMVGPLDAVTESERRADAAQHESFFRRLYNSDFRFEFIAHRRRWYLLSGALLLVSILALLINGLNLGVEFSGGSVFRAPVTVTDSTIQEFTEAVDAVGLDDMSGMQVTTIGETTVRVQTRSLSTEEVAQVRTAIASTAQVDASDVAYQLIGPSWGEQITERGIQALIVFLVLVALMIGLYFRNWKMSVSALAALLHDLTVTVGVYALIGFTVSPATIIGVLTILGYSLYDNVVVFDKVKENTRDITNRPYTYSRAANRALNQVLVRSINTTVIGVLPVVAILVAGVVWLDGQSTLADLGLAMFVGMVVGAYSSIFLAVPLLAQLKEREPAMIKHRERLAKREQRAQARIETKVATVEEALTPAAGSPVMPVVTAVPVPTRPVAVDEKAAGRPQPRRQPRSERKK